VPANLKLEAVKLIHSTMPFYRWTTDREATNRQHTDSDRTEDCRPE
jgi:hypothetical protein